jgi:hypothetical protein
MNLCGSGDEFIGEEEEIVGNYSGHEWDEKKWYNVARLEGSLSLGGE